ncbi:MAG: lipopolysaccharide biosynthesis protein [Chloroflexota bacterium]
MVIYHERPQASHRAPEAPPSEATAAPPTQGAIGSRATHGAFWTAVAFGITRASTLVINVLLARLLGPSDLGTVSFAMIFIGVLLLLQDLGVPAAIIYGARPAREVAGTALTMNVATALAFTLVVVAVSPWLAQWGNDPTIAPVVIALAAGLVVTAVGSVQNAVLTRELAFKKKAAPDVAPAIVGGLVSIVLALLGFGVWSLVIGYLAKVTGTTALLWTVSHVRARPEFRRPVAADLFRYGRHASLASIVGFVAGNSDYMVVGALMGSYALGVYTLAYNLASLPSTLVTQVIVTVLFPALSAVREHQRDARALLSTSFHATVALSTVMGLGIFICAPSALTLFLTERWAEVIPPLQILAAFGVLRSIGSWTSPIFKAAGRPDLEWRLSLTRLVLHVLLMLTLARFGINGIAASHLVVGFTFVVVGLVFVGRVTQIGMAGIWSLVRPHLLSGVPALALLATLILTPAGAATLANPIAAPVTALLLAAVYLGLLSRVAPEVLMPIRDIAARQATRLYAARTASATTR